MRVEAAKERSLKYLQAKKEEVLRLTENHFKIMDDYNNEKYIFSLSLDSKQICKFEKRFNNNKVKADLRKKRKKLPKR